MKLLPVAVAAAATYYALRRAEVPADTLYELARLRALVAELEQMNLALLDSTRRSRHARLLSELRALPEPHEVEARFLAGLE